MSGLREKLGPAALVVALGLSGCNASGGSITQTISRGETMTSKAQIELCTVAPGADLQVGGNSVRRENWEFKGYALLVEAQMPQTLTAIGQDAMCHLFFGPNARRQADAYTKILFAENVSQGSPVATLIYNRP